MKLKFWIHPCGYSNPLAKTNSTPKSFEKKFISSLKISTKTEILLISITLCWTHPNLTTCCLTRSYINLLNSFTSEYNKQTKIRGMNCELQYTLSLFCYLLQQRMYSYPIANSTLVWSFLTNIVASWWIEKKTNFPRREWSWVSAVTWSRIFIRCYLVITLFLHDYVVMVM